MSDQTYVSYISAEWYDGTYYTLHNSDAYDIPFYTDNGTYIQKIAYDYDQLNWSFGDDFYLFTVGAIEQKLDGTLTDSSFDDAYTYH